MRLDKLVLPDQSAPPVHRVTSDLLVSQAVRVNQDCRVFQDLLEFRVLTVSRADQDQRVTLDHWVCRESLDIQDLGEPRVTLDHVVIVARRENRVQLASQVAGEI